MTYGSLGKGQFLIWNVGYLGLGPIQVSLAHMLSVPVSPFSNSKKKAAPFLAPLPPSLSLIVAKHSQGPCTPLPGGAVPPVLKGKGWVPARRM